MGLSDWKQKIFGFVVLVILLGVVCFAVVAFWKAFSTLKSEIATAIVAACGTILVSILSLIFSKNWERQREIEQEHRR